MEGAGINLKDESGSTYRISGAIKDIKEISLPGNFLLCIKIEPETECPSVFSSFLIHMASEKPEFRSLYL